MSNRLRQRFAAAVLLLVAASAGAAERTRLVKASVFITGAGRAFRHQISVTNKDPSRHVLSVLAGQFPGLVHEPTSVSVPDGWQSQVLRREGRDGVLWSVRFTCIDPKPAQAGGSATSVDGECGLRAGQSVKFAFLLPYEAASLESEPLFVDFSDGRTGIASR